MKHETEETTNMNRRRLMLSVGVGGAGAAAAIVAGRAGVDQLKDAPGKQPQDTTGYTLTEHVRNYYRTARV